MTKSPAGSCPFQTTAPPGNRDGQSGLSGRLFDEAGAYGSIDAVDAQGDRQIAAPADLLGCKRLRRGGANVIPSSAAQLTDGLKAHTLGASTVQYRVVPSADHADRNR